jgi:hypothetical protein
MSGFDKKTLHLKNSGNEDMEIAVETDFIGNEQWNHFKTIKLKAGEYKYYIFPDGYSAQWVRLKVNKGNSVLTAQFVYD